jgi:hypothetical protein
MKVGRNDPCPCGSGKKYKKCCLATDEAREMQFRRQIQEHPADQALVIEHDGQTRLAAHPPHHTEHLTLQSDNMAWKC